VRAHNVELQNTRKLGYNKKTTYLNYMPLDVSQVIENTKQYNIRTNASRNITQHLTYHAEPTQTRDNLEKQSFNGFTFEFKKLLTETTASNNLVLRNETRDTVDRLFIASL